VVPLPSEPEITPATRGLFPTLRAVFQPRVRVSGHGLFIPLLFTAAALMALLHLRHKVWRFVGFVLIATLGVVFTLPSLGTARGPADDSPQVRILDRRVVGDFNVTTLASSDGGALTSWLREHEFECSPDAAEVIADYARRGWVFAAMKLRREADSAEPATPQPLVFTFKADAPVYPMRLTGVDADRPLSLELFVFGDRRARASGMKTASAADVQYLDHAGTRLLRANTEHLRISHAGLSEIVSPTTFGTRLTGSFTPEQMARDLMIEWEDAAPAGRLVYSDAGARAVAWEIGLGVLCLGVIAAACIGAHGSPRRTGVMLAALSLPVIVGGAAFAMLPIVPVTPRSAMRYSPARALGDYVAEQKPASLEQARSIAAQAAASLVERGIVPSDDSPTPPREEDSPGNYTTREEHGAIWFVWYDLTGQEHAVHLGPAPPR